MSHTVTLEQLTIRLGRLESELSAIRRALEMLQQDAGPPTMPPGPIFTNKISLSEQIQQLLQRFSIIGQPVGSETLQGQMAQANLNRNELSQSLIEARGE
jgi:hypothetical protein